ncbi:MAG: inositol polyphosphate 5-phosphatase [Peltula sp. TS41687]|nr:MAG: inositol polyphosphate 5-phosphatase [Peltula sp. TS41687]
MSIKVLLRSDPHRALALVTSSHALIIRHSSSSIESFFGLSSSSAQGSSGNGVARCMVEFSILNAVDLSDYRPLTPLPVEGTLGLITVDNDVFLCVVHGSTRVATVRPGETVQRVEGVEFYCLNNDSYDNIPGLGLSSYQDPFWQDGSENDNSNDRRETTVEHPCAALKKLLSGGSFYYSSDFDLTNRLQDRSTHNVFDTLDDEFLWNSYMIKPLMGFRARLQDHEREALDASRILTSAIRGFALSIIIPMTISPIRHSDSGLPSILTLISRLSCRRAGTRFNARGIDDDGNVANFVETETIFYVPSGLCFSYTQIRGSIPIFWEQAPGLLPGQQKIQITRSVEATQPAFDKHFEELERAYGAVHILNLLSETKPGELELTERYRYHVRHCSLNSSAGKNTERQIIRETEFDFHAQTKGPSGYEAASAIHTFVRDSADGFAYCLVQKSNDSLKSNTDDSVILQQEGVFRTNCLDCLDRTNLIQTLISKIAIESFFGQRREVAGPDFWIRHSSLWADNGDSLSKIYAGTGALKTSFTRHGKMSLAGALADARKSATRMYINNFADKSRQNVMDMLLGRLIGQVPVHLYDPINDFVSGEVNKRTAEYSSPKSFKIWVGTFNLNGRIAGINEDLSPWLCPGGKAGQQAEIVVVGFQEIVELSPQHIMSTDPTVRQMWERAVKRTLDEQAKKSKTEEYVLLRSGQLVGAALLVFVRSSALEHIKNVEGSVKKTGLSGMAGNKGAVAIRMNYADTRICFVTAHLAAGFANYDERNKDYNTITHGLRFQRNYSIEDHDAIIWLGDFNYRIGLNDEKVRRLAQLGDLHTLYDNDQLNLQMVAGLTFPFYSESKITFMPTYRYDVGTDVYDTSEKHRIPAWCDRVLWKGKNLRQVSYDSAPLRFSDHRPVYAEFQIKVNVVDEALKERLSLELYRQRRNEVGDATANKKSDDLDDEDLIGYDPIEPGLPPASSDRRRLISVLTVRKLATGVPARSNIKPPQPDLIPNPQRPSNPFSPTAEPDWVEKTSSAPQALNRAPTSSIHHPPDMSSVSRSRESSNRPTDPRRTGPEPISDPSLTRSNKPPTDNLSRKPAPPPIPKKPAVLSPSSAKPEDQDLSRHGDAAPKKPFPPPSSTAATTSRNPSTGSSLPRASTAGAAAVAVAEEDYHPTSINARIQQLRLAGSGPGRQQEGSHHSPSGSTGSPDNGPPLPPRRRTSSDIAMSTHPNSSTGNSHHGNTTTAGQLPSNGNSSSVEPAMSQSQPQPQPQALLDANDTDMRRSLQTWKPLRPD